MKIQIVMNASLPVPALLGGAVEKRWHAVARCLAPRHEVTMISRLYADLPPEEVDDAGVHHIRLPGWDWSNRWSKSLARSARWCWRVRRHLEPGDILVANDILSPALLPRLRPQAGRVCVDVQRMPKWQHRYLYGGADRFYCTSSAVIDEMRRVAPARIPRCRLMPNPTNLQTFHPPTAADSRAGEPRDRIEILYAGRIHPEKGLGLLMRAVGQMRSKNRVFLRLIGPATEATGGDSSFADELRRLAASQGLTAEDWSLDPPVFDERALAAVYRGCDLFVYPSQAVRGETFGVAVLEAMASGKPCVVSDLACFRDLVTPEENGFIVSATEPAAWAAALDRLVEDTPLRSRLGERSREMAGAFSVEAIAAQIEDDFTQLLAGSDTPAASRATADIP